MSKHLVPRVLSPFRLKVGYHQTSFSHIPQTTDLSQGLHSTTSVYSLSKLREQQSTIKPNIKLTRNTSSKSKQKPNEYIADSTQPSIERSKSLITLEKKINNLHKIKESEEKCKLVFDIWEQLLTFDNPASSLLMQIKITVYD